MFTGIIEELGKILSIKRGSNHYVLKIFAPMLAKEINVGDSIAVNGVCLTATSKTDKEFTVDVMPETARKTNIDDLKPEDKVNLERALTLSSRLGGHLVSGHVDGVGVIESQRKEQNAILFKISAPNEITRYLINRGSIAVDGISLTVMDYGSDYFVISIIPHTAKMTTLGFKKPNDKVNLENDLIAKYVERFVNNQKIISGQEDNIRSNQFDKSKLGSSKVNNTKDSSLIEKLRDLGYS